MKRTGIKSRHHKVWREFRRTIRQKIGRLAEEARVLVAHWVADSLGYSRATVLRWFAERTRPHPVAFPTVFQAIDDAKVELKLA